MRLRDRIRTAFRVMAGRNPADPHWWSASPGTQTLAGVRVTPETALALSAVFASVRVLSNAVAMIPLGVTERLENGDKQPAPGHPLHDLFRWRTNNRQTAFRWRRMAMVHLLLRGNHVSEIIDGPRGIVDQLRPIHPDHVTVERIKSSDELRYKVHEPERTERTLLPHEVLHLRGLEDDPTTGLGLSVVSVARQSLGTAIAAERFAGGFWGNGTMTRIFLQHPGEMSDPAKGNLLRSLRRMTTGATNVGGLALLEDGITVKEVTLNAKDAQFIESRQFTPTEIARWFGVPPHLIADLTRSTNNNIEQQSLDFLMHAVEHYLTNMEQELRALFVNQRRYEATFNREALLAMDTEKKFKAFQTATGAPWMTRNEVRKKLNQNPVEGGDVLLVPVNMAPANQPRPAPALPPPSDRDDDTAERLARFTAAGVRRVRMKESRALHSADLRGALATTDTLNAWARTFYNEKHAEWIEDVLQLEPADAALYCILRIEGFAACDNTRSATGVVQLVKEALDALNGDTDDDGTQPDPTD